MSEQPEGRSGSTRRPDPMLGNKLSSRPSFPPLRPDGGRGVHRRRDDPDEPTKPERTRIVLADPRKNTNLMRPRVELEQNTNWGAGMVKDLARLQLRTALRVALVVVLLLGSLPLAYYLSPAFAQLTVIGVPLAWVLLGVAPFPVLFCAGLWYNHMADRHERAFVEMFDG